MTGMRVGIAADHGGSSLKQELAAVCGSGAGASVYAHKVSGVRAALIADHFSAREGVEDDHLNIICQGGRTAGPSVAWDLVQAFVSARFSHADRRVRRLQNIAARDVERESR